jgi:hypothetical protein
MITVGLRCHFRAVVRRLYSVSNFEFVLTQRSYYTRRVYIGELFLCRLMRFQSTNFFLPVSRSIICPIVVVSYRS